MKECNVLKNRADCMNRVHEYVNTVAPLVRERLKQGFKTKVDGKLYQNDADDVRAILDSQKGILEQGTNGRTGNGAYVSCDKYSIVMQVSDHYPVKYHEGSDGGYTCEYYKDFTYLWNNQSEEVYELAGREMTSEAELVAAQAELKEIETQLSDLKDKTYSLKRLLGK